MCGIAGYLRLRPENSAPISADIAVEMLPAEDGLFELVGTGFNNASMPLIGYRCGDLVRPAPSKERCACGRWFPLIERIVGRVDDSIKLPDGRSLGRLDHLFKGVEGILEAQIRQDRLDDLTIRVVPSGGFNGRTRETLQDNAGYRLGDGVAVEIQMVDAIPRTKNGKFKGVICNVGAGTDKRSDGSPGEQR